jgi:hypothetical protein
VLARITAQTLELSGADLALLALPEEPLPQQAWRGDSPALVTFAYADGDGADAARGLVFSSTRSLSGLVLAHGEHVTTADFGHDRADPAARQALSHIGPPCSSRWVRRARHAAC